LQINGIEGVDWAVINGIPQLIGQMLATTVSGTQDYVKQRGINNTRLPTLNANSICSDGFPIALSNSAEQIGLTVNKADNNFVSSLDTNKKGFMYPGQIYDQWAKDGLTTGSDGYPGDIFFYGSLDPSMTPIDAACGQYMNAQYAKIILAKDDAAFASVKAETIAKMKSLGSDQIFAAYQIMHKTAEALKTKAGF